jgi:hypothetical protein
MCSSSRTKSYVSLAIMAACAALLVCEAMVRVDRAVETGQPRELINQPLCGPIDGHDDGRRCELAHHS